MKEDILFRLMLLIVYYSEGLLKREKLPHEDNLQFGRLFRRIEYSDEPTTCATSSGSGAPRSLMTNRPAGPWCPPWPLKPGAPACSPARPTPPFTHMPQKSVVTRPRASFAFHALYAPFRCCCATVPPAR